VSPFSENPDKFSGESGLYQNSGGESLNSRDFPWCGGASCPETGFPLTSIMIDADPWFILLQAALFPKKSGL